MPKQREIPLEILSTLLDALGVEDEHQKSRAKDDLQATIRLYRLNREAQNKQTAAQIRKTIPKPTNRNRRPKSLEAIARSIRREAKNLRALPLDPWAKVTLCDELREVGLRVDDPEHFYEAIDRIGFALSCPNADRAYRPAERARANAIHELSDIYERATGRRFTRQFRRGEPISHAAQFVFHFFSTIGDRSATNGLDDAMKTVIADRRKAAGEQ